jgi:hypothetical protein
MAGHSLLRLKNIPLYDFQELREKEREINGAQRIFKATILFCMVPYW